MVVYCCLCKASGNKGFFQLPTGPRRANFLKVAELPQEEDLNVKTKSLKFCFRHFQGKDLVVVGNQVRLSKGEFIVYTFYHYFLPARRNFGLTGKKRR